MEKNVLCAGTYVVDIITGMLNEAVAAQSGHHTRITSNPGGNALNVAIDLAHLTIPGTSIFCCGAMGNDFEGEFLKSCMARKGIIDRTTAVDNHGTSKSLILSFEHDERAFIVDKGASVAFKSGELLSLLSEIKPFVFYIGESLASPDVDRNLASILQRAKECGCTTVLDYIVYENIDRDSLFRSASYTDFLHLNEYESRIITGSDSIADAAVYMRESGFPMVVVSEGEKGYVLSYGNTLLKMPVFPVTCADATGAGDAFCSGVIYHILKTGAIPRDDREAVDMALFASACGGCAVTEIGCTNGVSLERVEKLVEAKGESMRKQMVKKQLW